MNYFKQTRLKVSSAVCIILAMLLTVFAYGIKPSRTVMADSDLLVPSTVTAFTQEEPARMYPYNGTYREPVQWFSFTPESSGLYRINLGGVTMSETISVYDSSMKLLGIGPLYVSLPMAEDETYYIRIEEFEADAYGPYKYIEISV